MAVTEQKFKRNIAYKLRIGDLLIGKPIIEADRFKFLDLGNKKVTRVNIIGNVIDKYESEGEKRFVFFTIDDGSGQIQLKVFGEEIEKFKEIQHGETILIIGLIRHWNGETYISPEVIRNQDPRYLLVRKIEVEKERSKQSKSIETTEQIMALNDRIMEMIKNSEEEGGIEKDKIIMNIRDASPETINQEIQKALEEGVIFEPRPGKVRYLG